MSTNPPTTRRGQGRAPPPPSPNSTNSGEFLNLNDMHSIFCDCGDNIAANQIEMQTLKDQVGKDFIVCRVDHISLHHKLEDHDKKLKAIALVMGGVMVTMLGMMMFGVKVLMKPG
ncbi:unnamed protein product [Lactuca virosa]|uniref:Uncharacterized protein n=1 Tax=Lactuca virosa TaxID=75947 RepID=A0AAU9LLC6_9ASTR|nr:unnamed protein product [Lactuca virosa]